MNIAIDARPLSDNLTGIGRYTYNILLELFKQDKSSQFYLYSHKPLIFDFSCFDNVIIRTGNQSSGLKSTLFSQIVFPIWCYKDSINTFWSPRHHLPLVLFFIKKIKKVVTIHDVVWIVHPETMSKFGLIVEKLLFKPSVKMAQHVITLSKFTKDELLAHTSTENDKVIHAPIGTLFNVHDKTYERSIDVPYILFVGTLEPRKNLENLLLAYKKLTSINNMKLVIVGKDGWGNIKISTMVKTLELSDKVIQLGYVTDDELHGLYQHCELLAMPSVYEGYGLPAIEALSFGKKVLVGKKSAIPELGLENVITTDIHCNDIYFSLIRALGQKTVFVDIECISWKTTAKITNSLLLSDKTD